MFAYQTRESGFSLNLLGGGYRLMLCILVFLCNDNVADVYVFSLKYYEVMTMMDDNLECLMCRNT